MTVNHSSRIKINGHHQWVAALEIMGMMQLAGQYGVKVAKSYVLFRDPQARDQFQRAVLARIDALKGTRNIGRLNALNSLRRHLGGALKSKY